MSDVAFVSSFGVISVVCMAVVVLISKDKGIYIARGRDRLQINADKRKNRKGRS